MTNLLVPVAFITIATNGNIIRAYLLGIPIVVGTLYMASWVAPLLTDMALSIDYKILDGEMFTSF